jgi:hypothetical protein
MARLAVAQIADWCAVDLLDDHGEIRDVAVHHADPAKLLSAIGARAVLAAAMSGLSPTDMLHTLHQALRRQSAGADLCTVCLVTMKRAAERMILTVALAGHLPPLLLDGRGARQIGRPGTCWASSIPSRCSRAKLSCSPARRCCSTPRACPRPAGRAISSASAGCSSCVRAHRISHSQGSSSASSARPSG